MIWGDAVYLKNPATLPPLKRAQLELAKQVLLPQEGAAARFIKQITARARKGQLRMLGKEYLKRALAALGLIHPALGVKTDGAAKAGALMREKTAELKVLVETGTNNGETIHRIGKYFDKMYSIELDETLHAAAQERFASKPSVVLYQGDSAVQIKKILEQLHTPALFFLDAHGSGTITGENAPVLDELRAIFAHSVRGHVIVIDDARLFGRPTIGQLRQLAAAHGYRVVIEEGLFKLHHAPS